MNRYALAACAGSFLGIAFLYSGAGSLVMIAFVPLLLAIQSSSMTETYRIGLTAGIIAFVIANYWIYRFAYNLTGSIWQSLAISGIYIVYSAHNLCLFTIGARILTRWFPATVNLLLIPTFGTCSFSAYPAIFEFSLASSQAGNASILHPIAVTGHWGLSFFILLVNLLIFNNYLAWKSRRPKPACFFVAALATAIIGWYFLTLNFSPKKESELTTLIVGFHQMNDAPKSIALHPNPMHTLGYTQALKNSYSLAEQGAKLIIWPESRPKGLLTYDWVYQAYRDHAAQMNAAMIVHDVGRSNEIHPGQQNSSIFISPEGTTKVYHKVQRIPFGEYMPHWVNMLPFAQSIKALFEDINKNIAPGSQLDTFPWANGEILPLICYEALFSKYVSRGIKQNPNTSLIVLQSNDSWFFSSAQARMHNNFAILRAVETRRPLLHIVNSGTSYFIQANGKVAWLVKPANTGSYLAELGLPNTISTNLTISSRYPGWFLQSAAILSFLGFAIIMFRSILGLPSKLRNA